MKKTLTVVFGSLIAATLMTGCGGGGEQSSGPDGGSTAKKIKVAMLPKVKGIAYFTSCAEGAQEAAGPGVPGRGNQTGQLRQRNAQHQDRDQQGQAGHRGVGQRRQKRMAVKLGDRRVDAGLNRVAGADQERDQNQQQCLEGHGISGDAMGTDPPL